MALRSPPVTRLFGIDLAATVAGAFRAAGGATPITLIKRTPRQVATATPAHGSRVTVISIEGRGLVEPADVDGRAGIRAVMFAAETVYDGARVVPEIGDAIEVDGVEHEIVGQIVGDPVGATWELTAVTAGRRR